MLAGATRSAWPGSPGKWPGSRQTVGSSRSARKALVFYGLVALGTVVGTALSLLHVNPVKLLVLVAVINGAAAAPFLVVVMRVSGSHRIMGGYVNGNAASVLGWLSGTLIAQQRSLPSPPEDQHLTGSLHARRAGEGADRACGNGGCTG